MFAASRKLNNLCLIIDLNYLQVEGHTDKVMNMEPLEEKFNSFGWNTILVDGHNFSDMQNAFACARNENKKPSALIMKTLPGKGVPSLEGKMSHNMVLPKEIAQNALKELGEQQ